MTSNNEEDKKQCGCNPRVKAEYVIREDHLCGEYRTPVRVRVRIGEGQVIELEESLEWEVEKGKMMEIEGAVCQVREEELEVQVRVKMKCIMAQDFERGSRKLAIPHQIILPS